MRNILYPFAVMALLFASCQGGQIDKTENATSGQGKDEAAPQVLVSQIDISAEYFGDNSVTLRYDSEGRMVEMNPEEMDGVVKIAYYDGLVAVDGPLNSMRYEFGDNTVVETMTTEGNGEIVTEYQLKNGKVTASSSKFDGQLNNNKTYLWDGDLLAGETKEEFLDGEVLKSTTHYTYSTVKNYFNIDLLGLATALNLDDPKVGTFAECFRSALLPDEVVWEGDLSDGLRCQKTTQYEYTFSDELITEIVITEKSVVYETEEPYVWSGSETIKVIY